MPEQGGVRRQIKLAIFNALRGSFGRQCVSQSLSGSVLAHAQAHPAQVQLLLTNRVPVTRSSAGASAESNFVSSVEGQKGSVIHIRRWSHIHPFRGIGRRETLRHPLPRPVLRLLSGNGWPEELPVRLDTQRLRAIRFDGMGRCHLLAPTVGCGKPIRGRGNCDSPSPCFERGFRISRS